MKALVRRWLVSLHLTGYGSGRRGADAAGGLAIDEPQGDQYGCAVDRETVAAAQGTRASTRISGQSGAQTTNREDFNDALLLGLKATIAHAELHGHGKRVLWDAFPLEVFDHRAQLPSPVLRCSP